MVKTAVASGTIDEIVDFILEHDGPDLKRRAHPELKYVQYDDLEHALRIIHKQNILLDLRAFHFKNVRNIWSRDGIKNYALAREMTGLLMEELLQEHGNYVEVVKNVTFHPFSERELSYRTGEGVIRFKLESMLLVVYENSPSTAVTDYLQNHPDKQVREEFQGLKPYHFGMAPLGYWKSEEGQKEARVIIGQCLNSMLQECGGNWIEVVKTVRDGFFNGREISFENKFGRISINIQSVISAAYGSHVKAIIDLLTNNEDADLRKEFSGLRPYHFVESTHGIWDGKEDNKYAVEITDLVLREFAREKGISIPEAIRSIRGADFHRPLKFTNSYGSIEFNGAKALKNPHMYDNSVTRAISAWVRSNLSAMAER